MSATNIEALDRAIRERLAQATLTDYMNAELPAGLEAEFLAGALTDVLAVLREERALAERP